MSADPSTVLEELQKTIRSVPVSKRFVRGFCIGIAIFVIQLATSTEALAQCGSGFVALDWFLGREDVSVVFSGNPVTVTEQGGAQVIVFRVGRVWKGPVTQRTTIYRPLDKDRNANRPFVPGKTYVAAQTVVEWKVPEAVSQRGRADAPPLGGSGNLLQVRVRNDAVELHGLLWWIS